MNTYLTETPDHTRAGQDISALSVNVSDVLKHSMAIRIKVKGASKFKMRLAALALILSLAGKVSPVPVIVTRDETNTP